MVNIIWTIFIVFGIIFSIINGKVDGINKTILDSCKVSLEMIIQIFPVMAMWMGLMNIASKSKLLDKFSKLVTPILKVLFPEIPAGNESFSFIASNIVANIFGLGSAATPFGLRAMQSLQKLNKNKDVASRSMITFLVLNTSGLTLIPTTVITLRVMYHSSNPTVIVFACIIATLLSTMGGLICDRVMARRYRH